MHTLNIRRTSASEFSIALEFEETFLIFARHIVWMRRKNMILFRDRLLSLFVFKIRIVWPAKQNEAVTLFSKAERHCRDMYTVCESCRDKKKY